MDLLRFYTTSEIGRKIFGKILFSEALPRAPGYLEQEEAGTLALFHEFRQDDNPLAFYASFNMACVVLHQ